MSWGGLPSLPLISGCFSSSNILPHLPCQCPLVWLPPSMGFPGGSDGKVSTYNARRPRFNPWVRKILWRRKWQPTPVLLPGESHGQRSLVGYSPRGHKELDTTEQLHFTSGKKGNGKGGQSDLHASTFSSDSFSLKYSVRQGTLIWGSMF